LWLDGIIARSHRRAVDGDHKRHRAWALRPDRRGPFPAHRDR
jgi:hypothetical protein